VAQIGIVVVLKKILSALWLIELIIKLFSINVDT